MYYQSSEPKEPHLVFIGRWHPFHEGHKALIKKGMQHRPNFPILVLVRDTVFDEASAIVRAGKVIEWMEEKEIRGVVTTIPDVRGVYYGRGVGYEVVQLGLDSKTEEISGTKLREGKTTEDLFKE